MFRLPQLCSAVLLLSCTTSELPPDKVVLQTTPSTSVVIDPPATTNTATDVLPSLYPFGNQTSFIKGQVSATSNTINVSSFMTTRIAAPDMGTILNNGERLNMVVMGGGV